MTRVFAVESMLDGDQLGLALAAALTPTGVTDRPCFFSGFAAFPQVLARGLATLADDGMFDNAGCIGYEGLPVFFCCEHGD
jgi:hypothetical protein